MRWPDDRRVEFLLIVGLMLVMCLLCGIFDIAIESILRLLRVVVYTDGPQG